MFGNFVINPTYIGKTTRSLRKVVPILTGVGFYLFANKFYINMAYLAQLELYDQLPLNLRRFMETRDHRYLITIDSSELKSI